jgi:hypothetical protein
MLGKEPERYQQTMNSDEADISSYSSYQHSSYSTPNGKVCKKSLKSQDSTSTPASPTASTTTSTAFPPTNVDDDDQDDQGDNSVDDEEEDDDDGMFFEDYASNICFLVGSILYVWLAVWDIIDDSATDDDDDDGDDDEDDDPPIADDHFLDQFPVFTVLERKYKFLVIVRALITMSPYVLLSAGAAWCYVVDAGFQISKLVCHHDKKRSRYVVASSSASSNRQCNDDAIAMPLVAHSGNPSAFEHHSYYFYHNHGHIETSDMDSIPDQKGCWKKRRCVAGVMVGLTFGTGAAFDLAASFIVDKNEPVSDMLSMVACHIYLVNALLLTAPLFFSYQWKDIRQFSIKRLCRADNLEYLGDLFFLIGSIIDVLLSYWNLEFTGLNLVDYGYLLSAILWLIDAIFYIAADYIGFDDDDDDSIGHDANTSKMNDQMYIECDDHSDEQLAILTEGRFTKK